MHLGAALDKSLYEVDVIPNVSTFLANIQQEISYFQSYRISQVRVELLPIRNVNTS